jgi:hypothetical protein
MFHLKEFANKFMKIDPEFGAVAFAFVIACMIWASPIFFLRDNVLGKMVMVASLIAMTLYHRIAGIIMLIAIIAILNQVPMKEGMANPIASLSRATPSPPAPSISFNSPDEFRQKYCVKEKGVPDDPTQSGKITLAYMLSPSFFTMDASGNPTLTKEQFDAFGTIDQTSFNKCTPLKLANGETEYETINNMCDPKCNWSIKTTTPTTAPTGMPSTEGFTPMLRPHIRTARHLITNGTDNIKSSVNRIKRQLF